MDIIIGVISFLLLTSFFASFITFLVSVVHNKMSHFSLQKSDSLARPYSENNGLSFHVVNEENNTNKEKSSNVPNVRRSS